MGIADVIIIVLFLCGAYLGYQSGFIKQINDFIILFIFSLLAGKLSDLLLGFLYKYLPFLNFSGKSEGLKSINIIFWKLVLFVLILMILISIIRKIYVKTRLENKINDTILDANLISKILGAVLSVPLMVILFFDVILILLSPNFNLRILNDSKLADTIMTKTPILASANANLYNNQKYIIERINESDNDLSGYKDVNNDIIDNMIDTNLIDEDTIKYLKDNKKLVGKRSKNKKTATSSDEEFNDEEIEDEEFENEGFDDESSEDEGYEDEGFDDEGFEDEEFDEEFDEGFDEGFEDESEDIELSEEYCNENPDEC